MTDILCRWLNDEVHLEPKLTGSGFAEQFSNGYLFGEVLHRHGLQNDFQQFSGARSSEAKLNNFMRLEPTFRLLEIPFNINMARDIMTEKPGVATRLMYQLFVALNRKKQRQLTGQSLECMKPAGKVKLERIETGIFQEQLKQQTPRQVDLNFEALISKFHEKQRQHEELVAREKAAQERKTQEERKEACQKALEKSCQVRERQTQMYAKLKPLETTKSASKKSKAVQFGETSTTGPVTSKVSQARSKHIAEETRASINAFEATIKDRVSTGDEESEMTSLMSRQEDENPSSSRKITVKAGETADYVSQIKNRVQVNFSEREEREKRRRRVLIDHMNAMHQQEEEKREKMLVERLMRQCQQERRIATQLMQIRREKDVIRNNRIFRQKQQEDMRLREFQEALDREAQLARQGEVEKQERLRFHKLLYQKRLAEKAKQNYAKNYQLCYQILLQVVDFSTKMAHYRKLTQGLVPAKIVRDWKMLLIAGQPLYEGDGDMSDAKSSEVSGSSYNHSQRNFNDNQQLLDDTDFQEYKNCHDEWNPPDDLINDLPQPPNPILSHVVYRLLDMIDPPKPPPTPPKFPKSLVRASFVGKPFTGKSTTLQRLEAEHNVVVLSVEGVLTKAVQTFFAEKKKYERQESHNEEKAEDAPVIINDVKDEDVPTITVETSSSVDINMSTTGASGSADAHSQEASGEKEHQAEVDQSVESPPQQHQHVGGEVTEEMLLSFTPMARLGYKAHTAMACGESLDDETAVEIFVEEIKQLPEGNCWVMDNFPASLEQAKLLASALTGQAKPQPSLPRQFALLAEREARCDEITHSACGLDIVLHFTATTDAVLERASKLASSVPQASNKLEQIQHRIMSYDEQWPALRRWYQRFRNLGTVNSNMDTERVYTTARDKVQEVINKSKQAEAMKRLGLQEDDLSCDVGSTSNISAFGLGPCRSDPITPSPPPQRSKRARRPSSAESPAKLIQQMKSPKRKIGRLTTPKPPIFAPMNLNAEPGMSEWVYCDLPLSCDLASGLATKWPAIEETYISTLKAVFQHLRTERDNICRYFHDRRYEFAEYLCRPDHKQEFVSQWQVSYNSLEPHLRREDAMKAELHHRVDDLCDKLWDITDTRRDQAEQERQRIVNDQWLEDHIGLLTNHFISVMQVELDRFYDTFMLLKDYYTGMEEKVPSKLPETSRLSLVKLTPTEAQEAPGSATSSTHDVRNADSATETEEQPTEAKAAAAKESPKRRVPLLPRQPLPEPTEDKGAKKKGGGGVQSPQPPVEDLTNLELDDQLVVHAFNSASAVVFHLVMSELKVLELAIWELSKPPSAKPTQEQEKPPETAKDDKGAKGKKGKSPASGKKGKASPGGKGKAPPPAEVPPTEPTVAVETPEQLVQRQRKCQLYKEHKAAIEKEENRVKLQLALIKKKALLKINEFKTKDKSTNEEMERWISECYKKEVDSVSTLSEVLRQAIENEDKLINELALPGASLEIRESILMLELSPPPSPQSQVETEHPDHFTVNQLLSLHDQLKAIAPSGFMLGRELINTLMRLTNQTLCGDILPDNWRSLTKEQIEQLCGCLYGVSSDCVDWKQFMVCAAQPWPLPSTQDLLEAMQNFSTMLGSSAGSNRQLLLNREQFMSADIWLTRQPTGEGEFDRNSKVKEAFYDVFCDPTSGLIDCYSLLLYLCADPEPREGLCKALTVAVGGSPVTSLNPDSVDQDITILLEDFHKVVTHGVHPDSQIERGIAMSDLLELFVSLSRENPNEIALTSLLSNPTSLDYLTSANNYSLPKFAVIFQTSSQNDTE